MNYRKLKINKKLLACFAISTTFCCNAAELAVYARQKEDSLVFYIENTTRKIIFLGEPQKAGVMVSGKSDKIEGTLNSSVFMSSYPWKHLILLTPKEEDRPHLWSHQFSLKVNRNDVGKLKKLEVTLWTATEEEYLKTILEKGKGGMIPQMKHVRIDVEILDDNDNSRAHGRD